MLKTPDKIQALLQKLYRKAKPETVKASGRR
jgi:hypothetical protein